MPKVFTVDRRATGLAHRCACSFVERSDSDA
jgi:hypothetical protein